jgi:superfamily II DNA or RNA helicase
MQILRTGMLVHARRHRWRVVDTRPYDDCQLVTLSGLGPANAGLETQLLVPFDAVEAVPPSRRLRFVPTARWRHACRDLLTGALSEDTLRAAGRARIDLLPHQLEPAIAVIRGDGCRLLLADDVGLGKTIQAGVTIAELRARGAAERILILTPAGLREQWAGELSERFDIQAAVVDYRRVARRVSSLPYGVNPWTTWPIAIASIDYVKRADVLPAVVSCAWDVVVVDEAHGLANDSDRHEAVAALAGRAAFVILLTATPHNGDARAFRSLCAIGGHRDRLLMFRRTRDAVKSGTNRRVHRLLLRPSADERRMHALLADFSRLVRAERGDASRDVWLALAVLHKRAYSSAYALQQTVARRLAAMEPEGDDARQLPLPLDSHGEADAADEAPGWQAAISLRDSALERRLLTSLANAAHDAAARETKLSALVRLLHRVDEPVIVFTEYRDTLTHIARRIARKVVVLHGGLSRQERSAALGAFAAGGRVILLATDAAGEGLNLHRACRTVVNLELPWNPMRLEQRIGRVDRIGQRRTVHAFHLIAAGTGEHRLLAELEHKIARARSDIGAPNPLGASRSIDADYRAARFVVGDENDQSWLERIEPRALGIEPVSSYQVAGVAEAQRLTAERALTRRQAGAARLQPVHDGPLAAMARNTTTRMHLGSRVLIIWEVTVEDGCGRCIFSSPIAAAISLTALPRVQPDKPQLTRLIGLVAAEALQLIEAVPAPRRSLAISAFRSFVAARVAREQDVAAVAAPAAFQPGLFDRRVHHAEAAARAAQQQMAEASARRMAILEQQCALRVLPPTLRLVLLP